MHSSTISLRVAAGFFAFISSAMVHTALVGFSTVDLLALTFDPFGSAFFVSTGLVSGVGCSEVVATGAVVGSVVVSVFASGLVAFVFFAIRTLRVRCGDRSTATVTLSVKQSFASGSDLLVEQAGPMDTGGAIVD